MLLAHSSNFLATKYLLRMCPFCEERMEYYLKFGINREFVKVIKIYLIFLRKFDRWIFFFRLCLANAPYINYEGFSSREFALTIWSDSGHLFPWLDVVKMSAGLFGRGTKNTRDY